MIYVLELTEGKYYVGYSSTTDTQRIKKHFMGEGAEWCKLYPPIRIFNTYDGALEEENNTTLMYMQQYGYNNVRGGKWTSCLDYKEPPKELAQLMCGDIPDRMAICDRCRRKGHKTINCIWQCDLDGDAIMDLV